MHEHFFLLVRLMFLPSSVYVVRRYFSYVSFFSSYLNWNRLRTSSQQNESSLESNPEPSKHVVPYFSARRKERV